MIVLNLLGKFLVRPSSCSLQSVSLPAREKFCLDFWDIIFCFILIIRWHSMHIAFNDVKLRTKCMWHVCKFVYLQNRISYFILSVMVDWRPSFENPV